MKNKDKTQLQSATKIHKLKNLKAKKYIHHNYRIQVRPNNFLQRNHNKKISFLKISKVLMVKKVRKVHKSRAHQKRKAPKNKPNNKRRILMNIYPNYKTKPKSTNDICYFLNLLFSLSCHFYHFLGLQILIKFLHLVFKII